MRERFYYPVLHKLSYSWDQLTTQQFLAVFQGLSLTGPSVFKPEMMNMVLNKFVGSLEQMKFEEVMTFFELFVKCCNQVKFDNKKVGELIDITAVIEFTN